MSLLSHSGLYRIVSLRMCANMNVWPSLFFSVMKRRRKQHIFDQRGNQAIYHREMCGVNEIHQVRCNEAIDDFTVVPLKHRLFDGSSDDTYDVIGNPAAQSGEHHQAQCNEAYEMFPPKHRLLAGSPTTCGGGNRAEDEEPRYAIPNDSRS